MDNRIDVKEFFEKGIVSSAFRAEYNYCIFKTIGDNEEPLKEKAIETVLKPAELMADIFTKG